VPLHRLPNEDIRLACRQKLETCELWLRRLIDEQLSQQFGVAYFSDGVHDGVHLFRKEIRTHAARWIAKNPNRYQKPVDTLVLEHLIDTLCKHGLYKLCFSSSLKRAFPEGAEEARTFFSRLVPIRNALSHANPMSIHDAERVLCYCDDVIEALKEHYRELNMNNTYNAPVFTRFVDSLGHSEMPAESRIAYSYADTTLRPGDSISLEVEIDSSFDPEDYTVEWGVQSIRMAENGTGGHFVLMLLPRHVSEKLDIQATLTSKRDWHRHGTVDARMSIGYRVLPPLE
jgi:hypothetical protein